MRNVGLIVARDLLSYVKTPTGYFIAFGILMVNGLVFNIFAINNDQEQLSAEVLVNFFYHAGIVTMVAGIFFSVRLLAEEKQSGTDVLLFTSPVREGEVVLGKYLSALSVLTLLNAITLYLPALIFINGRVSYGHIAAGYLGLFLLGAAVLAIGTFASSLTKNPFIAVLLSAIFVVLLELCWKLSQEVVDDPDMAEIIAYVALNTTHFSPFQAGLLQLSNVVFYSTVIYVSLLGATKMVSTQRWR